MFNRFFAFLLTTLFLIGCSKTQSATNLENPMCLESETTFAFRAYDENIKKDVKEVLPTFPWSFEIEIPVDLQSGERYVSLSLTIIDNNGAEEIWILENSVDASGELNRTLFVYDTKKKKWDKLLNIFEELPLSTLSIYKSDSGDLFLTGQYNDLLNVRKSFIAKYSLEQERFFILSDFKDGIPVGMTVFDPVKGTFWIATVNNFLFNVDPINPETIRQFEIPPDLGILTDLKINSENTLYLLSVLEAYPNNKITIFKSDTNEFQQVHYSNYMNLDYFSSLFVDKNRNLWLGDQAWKTPEDIWYQTIRSSVFVSNQVPEWSGYRWDTPSIILESSNGFLWFQSVNGMISLDPSRGEWCWFTTYQSNIVEDSDRNLWMIADNKLYKLPLGEQ
jgi:hypothetical protein